MASPNIPPAWPEIFLDRLALTGNATASAEAAGVDVSSAYNRRQRYPAFREEWVRVLGEREGRAGGGKLHPLSPLVGSGLSLDGRESESAATPLTPLAHGESTLSLKGRGAGGEVVARTTAFGVKLIRTGATRWSAGAEERFLVELSASASIRRAAAAAGFSQAAIYRRRLKQSVFAAAWDAAIETGKARVEALLVEAATHSFDPDSLPISDDQPRISVAEAISISKRAATGAKSAGKAKFDWGEEAAQMHEDEVAALREKIMGKLERVRERDDREKLAAGWARDEEHECWVPPQWVRREPG